MPRRFSEGIDKFISEETRGVYSKRVSGEVSQPFETGGVVYDSGDENKHNKLIPEKRECVIRGETI